MPPSSPLNHEAAFYRQRNKVTVGNVPVGLRREVEELSHWKVQETIFWKATKIYGKRKELLHSITHLCIRSSHELKFMM